MARRRKIEVFSAGCPVCQETINLVTRIACESCEVKVLDTRDRDVAKHASSLGIKSLPAVVVDGKPAECCVGRGVDEGVLRRAGVGRPAD